MLARDREMSHEISLSQPNSTLTDSEFEAVLALVCCFLDGSPLLQIHIVRSSYKPPDLEATHSLLSSARVKMEAGHGTMEGSTLLHDETIAICEIVAYFAQEYPQETATEIGGSPLPRFRCPSFLPRCEVPLRNWPAHLRMRLPRPVYASQ
jgi:hypothetical protein